MNLKVKALLICVVIAVVFYISTKSSLEDTIQISMTKSYTDDLTKKWRKEHIGQHNLANPINVSISPLIKVGEGRYTAALNVDYNFGKDEAWSRTLYIIADSDGNWQSSSNPTFFASLNN